MTIVQPLGINAWCNSAQKDSPEQGATKAHSQPIMIAKLNYKPVYRIPAASNSRRSAVVTVQQPAQAGHIYYVFRQISLFPLPTARFLERYITNPLVQTFKIVPGTVFSTDVPQMILAKADKVIGTLLFDALDKTLCIRVHVRLLWTYPFHFYASCTIVTEMPVLNKETRRLNHD